MKKEIIYIGDPMCSWCWGFAPVLRQIQKHFAGQFRFSLIVGGLRPGTAEPMNDEMRAYIKHHWQEVSKRTGQPFSCELLDKPGFIYDTEPSSRAVVTIRSLQPASAFEYFETLHRAFYAEGQDIAQTSTLTKLAQKFDISSADFKRTFESDGTKEETRADFLQARKLGISGFPSLLLRDGEQIYMVSRGYQVFEDLAQFLESKTL